MWITERTDAVLPLRATAYSSHWDIGIKYTCVHKPLGRFGQHQFTIDAFLLVNTGAVVTDLEKQLGWKLTYPQHTS